MGFSPPVPQQYSDWEVRVAVQLSLLLQVLLIFMGPMRKRSPSLIPRFIVWSCYLLADWVADLALGLLLNNMGNIGGGGGNSSSSSSFGLKRGGGGTGATAGNNASNNASTSPIIFAFWTPFLLLHLGGPDTITAYSLEDNELWLRHLIGLLFELFSASVIFFCSRNSNPLIHATVLMFVVGVIKYAERTISLYSGSVDGFRSRILDDPNPGPNYAKLMTEFDSKEKAGLVVEIDIANGEAEQAHKEMEEQETERLVLDSTKSVEARAYEFFLIFRRLFVNVILSFKERRLSQAFFLRDDTTDHQEETSSSSSDEQSQATMIRKKFEVIEVELNFIYDMVYTKAPVAYTRPGWVLRSVCSACLVSALLIFFFLDKAAHQIRPVDVGITYALLLGGLGLDAAALLMIFFSNRAQVYLEKNKWRRLTALRKAAKRWWQTRQMSGKTSQLNLISHALGKPDRCEAALCLRLGKVAACLLGMVADCLRCLCYCKLAAGPRIDDIDIVDEFVFIRRVRLNKDDAGAGEDDRGGRRFVSKWWCRKNEESVSESLLFGFIFRGLKDALQKLKKEQEERKKAAADAAKKKEQEATKEEDEEMEAETKDAMAEKDAIAEVCRRRGDGVVKSHKDQIISSSSSSRYKYKVILDSVVKSEFDESLLLWHIATDLCRHLATMGPPTEKTVEMQAIGETLSEYMLYLLIKQPDMLAATAGIGLLRYRDTRAEARRFFDSMAEWDPDHEDARRMLLSVNTSKKPVQVKGDQSKSVLFDAVILAKELRELDEELMWDVITGVWGEMLTFAAAKCRGSMHVRQLSRGGELITLVWFLMAHMGLGDMYQIQEGDAKAKLIVRDQ